MGWKDLKLPLIFRTLFVDVFEPLKEYLGIEVWRTYS
jgi:hypothetical protein